MILLQQTRKVTKQILLGLEYLHKNGIMHRDIKGANILVDNKGRIKLADFGASKKVVELATMTGAKSMKGTPYWMAPEVIVQIGHSFSADIWSVGCTVIEMATGKPPWSQQYQEVAALFHIGTTKAHPPTPDHLSAEAKDFLLKCLEGRKYVMQQFLNTDEQLSCPFTPSAFHCSSTGLNNVVEKKYINSMRLHGICQAFINNRRRKDAEQKPAKKSTSTAGMVEFVGFIKVNVVKGSDLAIRYVRSSDPYVMLTLGNQSVKTRVIKNNLNPVWNEKLMLSIPDNVPPLIVNVFDKDKFSTDGHMGEAEIDIQPLVCAASLENNNGSEPSTPLERRPEGKDKNSLVNNGMITVAEGKAKQDIAIKLQNVESGELHIEIECVPLSQ